MYESLLHIIHGFECFGRDVVKAGCFSLLEFGDGTFDLLEGDRGVDVDETWLLGNEFKDGVINRSVVMRTLWKCMLKTDMFSLALEARSPLSSFMAMLTLVLWCEVSPPVSRLIFSHARRGLNHMLCMLENMPLYQRALAKLTR